MNTIAKKLKEYSKIDISELTKVDKFMLKLLLDALEDDDKEKEFIRRMDSFLKMLSGLSDDQILGIVKSKKETV
jgi:DNA-binding phage protein